MKITIVYDNNVYKSGLKSKWGFSCLVEVENHPRILFDTGGEGPLLIDNMKKLDINPQNVDEIFISHNHWDHTGGLSNILEKNNEVNIYIPSSCHPFTEKLSSLNNKLIDKDNIKIIKRPQQIHEKIFSSGELKNIEQSLIVATEKGLVVIVGCSHPGVGLILKTASQFGDVYALIGGFHDFNNFDKLKDVKLICPTHCTKYNSEIISIYSEKCITGGAGRAIEI